MGEWFTSEMDIIYITAKRYVIFNDNIANGNEINTEKQGFEI